MMGGHRRRAWRRPLPWDLSRHASKQGFGFRAVEGFDTAALREAKALLEALA